MTNEAQQPSPPLGQPGSTATYNRQGEARASDVVTFTLTLGAAENGDGLARQWLCLKATKAGGGKLAVWFLCHDYPPRALDAARETIARYILHEGDSGALEFRHQCTHRAVLPCLGAWEYLIPQPPADVSLEACFPPQVEYLGHRYLLDGSGDSDPAISPPAAETLELRPDVLVGPAHNTRQKDETRRFDGSDYELIRLTREDVDEMIEAGINCLHVDAEQATWVERRGVFYWGVGGSDISFPEALYRSNYLGPGIFLDEPAVCTRDQVIRPRLEKEPVFRQAVSPQIVLDEFCRHFHRVKYEGRPAELLEGLAARADLDLGGMAFLQQNIYSWETMVSTAAYQLTEGDCHPPDAVVLEPPGRLGTRRTLPEMNMTYGCQIPVDDPKNLAGILYGFLRGAARASGKGWGMSIYGAVDRADSFWYQTHAYDLGARLFLYWDTYQLACVPYGEYLALSRNLRAHADSHPDRNLEALREAGEIAILLPPGYGLGHVHMGRGLLWGVGELNLERTNTAGVKYRVVMRQVFTEIERCIRLGVAYDLLWDLEGLDLSGYREVVRVREDGRVEVSDAERTSLLAEARTPVRPAGHPPEIALELSALQGSAPLDVTARATITSGSSQVYYTVGADERGIYHNDRVPWELHGPAEEDYRFLNWEKPDTRITEDGPLATVEIHFRLAEPGHYRLRAATADLDGRTAVAWQTIDVAPQ